MATDDLIKNELKERNATISTLHDHDPFKIKLLEYDLKPGETMNHSSLNKAV